MDEKIAWHSAGTHTRKIDSQRMDGKGPFFERIKAYRDTAEEARQIARTMKDAETRRVWDGIAEGWEQLAQQLGKGIFPGPES